MRWLGPPRRPTCRSSTDASPPFGDLAVRALATPETDPSREVSLRQGRGSMTTRKPHSGLASSMPPRTFEATPSSSGVNER